MAIGKHVTGPVQQMTNTDTTDNWYGSVHTGWTNSKTGEQIIFKEPGVRRRKCWQVWLYKTTEQKRGTKVAEARRKDKAIAEGRRIAAEYDTQSYWAIIP